jgi:hypothetical protein
MGMELSIKKVSGMTYESQILHRNLSKNSLTDQEELFSNQL